MTADNDPMAEIKASFFIECEELLESLQDGLEEMSDGASDSETINVVFRAVHSIKGGAGAFGLDDLVHFAHRYETALDEVRAGRLDVSPDAMRLFFQCADMLADLVHAARDDTAFETETHASLLARLDDLVGEEEEEDTSEFEVAALDFDLGLPDLDAPPEKNEYRLKFKPLARLFETGNEPIHLLRALRDIGEISIHCDRSALPEFADLNPEAPYLAFDITIITEEGLEAVLEVFDFVDGLCELEVGANTNEVDPVASEDPTGKPELATDADPQSEDPPEAEIVASAPAPTPNAQPESKSAPSAKEPAAAPRATVRVDLERIDRLVNLVGELVINQAMLGQSVAEAGINTNSSIAQGLEEFMQLTRDIQDSVMMIRAQPVKSLFQRMGRIVREASAAVEKDVKLVTEGEATEVDKTVIERLADPLTHMIRNAVDHGLERPDDRVAAGKPAQGVVSLNAGHRSGRVILEVRDDGAGINREKVRQLAIDKELIPADASLSDTEIDNLLFLPGFSTAKEISNLSGRGVGMDVVRSAIQALGGRISIASEPGKGTVFTISLPLTLAVLDGMVVRAAGETLVVPLNAIMETFSLKEPDIRQLGPETQVVHIRDRFEPLLDLGAELGFRDPLDSYAGCIVLLIAHEDGSRAAVIVDAIDDQRQVVIKGLHDSYGRVPGVAAATILGDGQIALILDPVDLTSNASGRTRIGSAPISLAG